MKTKPDRTDVVKELEERLLKKWNDQNNSKPAKEEKQVVSPTAKKKK
jgi:hypothetical protein